MEMDTDAEETLRTLAAGGIMDYSAWPLLLATVVSHIEKTAHNDFPIPRIPPPTAAAPPAPPEPRFLAPLPPSSDPAEPASSSPDIDPLANPTSSGNESVGPSSQDTNKENDAPAPAPAQTSTSTAPEPSPAVDELEPGTLPPQITAMLAEITGVLNETFHTYPPHTIQRLAELVLEPRKHYRSLPSYLHAVDRVVHVTSGNNIYPLPPAIPDMSHMHINGVTEASSSQEDSGDQKPEQPAQAIWASSSTGGAPIGSDEALGGALLTPIPWLARRAANGGDGSSESGESSTLGSDVGGSSLAVGPGQGAGSNTSASSSPTSQQRQGRQFEMQVRTESTEKIDGPNGMGSIETVSVSINGVSSMSAAQQQRVITQGELIRQEQRAGVVPVSQLARSGPVVVTSSPSGPSADAEEDEADTAMGEGEGDGEGHKDTSSEKSDEDMADEDEPPHARGPDLIGAADMGPQKTGSSSTFSISHGGNAEVRGIDVEAAVGRKHESQIPSAGGQGEGATASDDSDGIVVLTPASSDPESTIAPEPVQGTIEGGGGKDDAGYKEEASEEKTQDGPAPEGMDTESKSATLSARSSPIKREADSDIPEAESEAKRLKSSTLEDKAATSADVPAEAETAAPKPVVQDETEMGAESHPEKGSESTTAVPDRTVEAKNDTPALEQTETQADAPSEPEPTAADGAD